MKNSSKLSIILLFCSAAALLATVETLTIGKALADPVTNSVQYQPQSNVINTNNTSPYLVNVQDGTLSIISGQAKTVIGNATQTSNYLAAHPFNSSALGNTYIINVQDGTLSIVSGQAKTTVGNPEFTYNLMRNMAINVAEPHVPFGHKAALSSLGPKVHSSTLAQKSATSKPSTHPGTKSNFAGPRIPHPTFIP